LATFPAAIQGVLPIGSEAVSDLGRIAQPLLDVDGTIRWAERRGTADSHHPEHSRLGGVLSKLRGARAARARQLFYWCLVEGLVLDDPKALEEEFNRCVSVAARALKGKTAKKDSAQSGEAAA
jgi:hypothetical protein